MYRADVFWGAKISPGAVSKLPREVSLFLNGQRESGLNGFCVCGGIFRSNVQNHRVPAGFQGSERLRRDSDNSPADFYPSGGFHRVPESGGASGIQGDLSKFCRRRAGDAQHLHQRRGLGLIHRPVRELRQSQDALGNPDAQGAACDLLTAEGQNRDHLVGRSGGIRAALCHGQVYNAVNHLSREQLRVRAFQPDVRNGALRVGQPGRIDDLTSLPMLVTLPGIVTLVKPRQS